MPRKSDKRERLIDSAKSLMFRQGFNLTTLADIAQEADVPLGNVYYYFKTKESIGDAVIAHCLSEQNQRLLDLDALATPQERLNTYIDQEVAEKDWIVKYGDKYGSLCQELAKQGGPLAAASANLLSQVINWLQKQFCEAGYDSEKALDKARVFVAKLQGVNLMAATFGNASHIEELNKWLRDGLATGAGSASHVTSTEEEQVEAFA